ncbi:MAG: lipocalin family protein [Ignavibacteriaceae bacterium]|nr:lipocalin family protein [Ignavibacteriaceae bacterium]
MKLLLIMLIPVLAFAQQKNISTVDKVDLSKYLGLWYEIARIPNSFQDDCVNGTTAKYSLMNNGDIKVINSCMEADGGLNIAEGVARVVDKKTNSKLEVSFVSLFGWHLFWGDYWIIGLDDNYKWAVIGHPKRKYGWILSRTPKLDETTMTAINKILFANGYDPQKFVKSEQMNVGNK